MKLFTAEWCDPCEDLKATDEFQEHKDDLDIVDVTEDTGKDEAEKHNVRSVPQLVTDDENIIGPDDIVNELSNEIV